MLLTLKGSFFESLSHSMEMKKKECYWFCTTYDFSSECKMQIRQKNSFLFDPVKALQLHLELAAMVKAVKEVGGVQKFEFWKSDFGSRHFMPQIVIIKLK
jgi:hypothetical protein